MWWIADALDETLGFGAVTGEQCLDRGADKVHICRAFRYERVGLGVVGELTEPLCEQRRIVLRGGVHL
jgi:hypothetical protein